MNLVINVWTFLYLIIGISIISVLIYVFFIPNISGETRHHPILKHSEETCDEDGEVNINKFVSTGHPEECLNQKPELKKKGFFSRIFNGNENDPKVVNRIKSSSKQTKNSTETSPSIFKSLSKLGNKNSMWIKGVLNYTGLKDYLGIDDEDVEEFLERGEDKENEDENFGEEEGWMQRRKNALSKSSVHYISAECAYAGEDVDVYKNSNHELNFDRSTSSSNHESCGAESNAKKPFKFFGNSRSDFNKIGLDAFKEIVKEYGGNTSKIKENIKITSQAFNVDLYYEEGIHKIAIDFKPIHYSIYPNSIHKTKADFEKFVRTEDLKKLIAFEEEKIYLIFVPYTVDQCMLNIEDVDLDDNCYSTSSTTKNDVSPKWVHSTKNSSEKERHQKIRRDLYRKLVEYYETLTSGYYFM